MLAHHIGTDGHARRDSDGKTFGDKGNGDRDTRDDQVGNVDPVRVIFAQPSRPSISLEFAVFDPVCWGMSAHHTTTTIMIMVIMMEQMTMTKLKTSFSRVVIPFFGSLVSFAILPKMVLSLVATTTPVHVPEMQ